MNLELTDEQVALRDTIRRFLAERAPISGHVRPLLDDPTGLTDAVWRGLADLGTTGLLVPEEYGGAGMTMVEAGIVAEELGAALHPGPWLSTAVAAPRALARFGAEDAQNTEAAKLLTGFADGTTVAAVGPLDGARVAAVPRESDVTLRGEFSVLDAAAADVLLVLAEDAEGAGLYAVKTTSPGVSATPEPGIDQTRKQFRVALDDAAGHRLAAASSDAVAAVVDDVLIATAADALGAARAVLSLAVEYAKVRKQFGQAIGSFQAIQHLCVDMYRDGRAGPQRGNPRAVGCGCRRLNTRRTAPGRAAGQSVCRATGQRGRHRDPGVRWHRLHLGARRSPLPQAAAELERIARRPGPLSDRTRCAPG